MLKVHAHVYGTDSTPLCSLHLHGEDVHGDNGRMHVGPDRRAGVQASMSTPSSGTAWSRASATESPLPARGSRWAAMSGCCCFTRTASAARPARRAWAAEWARSSCRRQDQVTLRVRLPPRCVSPALMSPHNITLHPRGWRTWTPISSVLARNTGS